MGLIKDGKWKDSCGKFHNSGKKFFLEHTTAAVRDLNCQQDTEGITYARKPIILTGMSWNTNVM